VVTPLPTLPTVLVKKLRLISSNVALLGKENLAFSAIDQHLCGAETTKMCVKIPG
jgi:hypothetical protein